MGIANTFGCSIQLDKRMLHGMDKRKVVVMVELNILKGLPKEVEILSRDRIFKRRLDYLHIPFQYFWCKGVSHSKTKCMFLLSVEVSCDGFDIKVDT